MFAAPLSKKPDRASFKFALRREKPPEVAYEKAAKLPAEEQVMIVQGVAVASKEEWRTAQALDILQVRYEYQYPISGGRSRRGGQMLDFMLYTPVRWTVLDVRGTYWHTGKYEDDLDLWRVIYGRNWNLVILWDTDCRSVSEVLTFLRQKLPHG